jgi:hypothetical protein
LPTVVGFRLRLHAVVGGRHGNLRHGLSGPGLLDEAGAPRSLLIAVVTLGARLAILLMILLGRKKAFDGLDRDDDLVVEDLRGRQFRLGLFGELFLLRVVGSIWRQ